MHSSTSVFKLPMPSTPRTNRAGALLALLAFFFAVVGACGRDHFVLGAVAPRLLALPLPPVPAMPLVVPALAHLPGGHSNPAVTIGFWVTKRVTTVDTI